MKKEEIEKNLAKSPSNPVGPVEMTDAEMRDIKGGLSLAAGRRRRAWSSFAPIGCKPKVCSTILTCYRCRIA